ncbi:unnamed protein product [Phytophthora fragariaefolia]|uniref:Unnamed protein product n=1 Tax=Phytophthora fragariaefolia TaxID=1490495 RepID=A0A9W6X821_9STRA|nr:unnamed protein product [Phytophthora fragariaefolia]
MERPGPAPKTTIRQPTGFDFTDFMTSFQPGLATEVRLPSQGRDDPSQAAKPPRAEEEAQTLRQELECLRGQVEGVRQLLVVLTKPNDQGELSAASVQQLTSGSFPEHANSRARRGAKRGFRPETSMTAGRQVATQSTAPMMVIRPRATRTTLQPAAPEMAIQPRSATVPEMAIQSRTSPEMVIQPRNPPEMAIQPRTTSALVMTIQPRTTSAPEMVIQPREVETDSGPEDTQVCTDFGARATRTTHNVITSARAARVTENVVRRATGFEPLRRLSLNKALGKVGLQLPTSSYPASQQSSSGTELLLNTPLQRTLSEFVRRTHMPLPALVELVRGQTETDYRPNKHMVPAVIAQVCKEYQHLEKLQAIAAEGVRVELKKDVPLQAHPPDNHRSTIERVNILRKNVRKEQDAWRCLVLDLDLLAMWPEVFVSPFGIVDKAGDDPRTSGRTIHDLSFPEGASINDVTDQDGIQKTDYRHCDAVASEILRIKREHPDIEIKAMVGDVTSAFRNIPIHSRSVHHFAGRIEIENALVVELAYPFGWTGSPGEYEVIEGVISFVHGSHGNRDNPTFFFNYHWVDDHINVAADPGTNCEGMERSLRYAMTAILGSGAVNEDKFTEWNTSQKILGLKFDTIAETISIPAAKIAKARNLVASASHSSGLSRKMYRSLMGGLRHMATCIWAARPFLQRLRLREMNLHRFRHVTVCDAIKLDLLWWWQILHFPLLNGVALQYFISLPEPDVVVEMDACDHGLCALDTKANIALTHGFRPINFSLLHASRPGKPMASTLIFGNCSPVHLLPTNGVPGGPRVPRKDVAPSTYIFVSTILRPWPGKTALRHPTRLAAEAQSAHMKLRGSKTNQCGHTTAQMLYRSGHPFLCPVFGALLLLRSRQDLPLGIPAAVYLGRTGPPVCISTAILSSAVKKTAAQNGEDPKNFSPHSFRAGGATHMYRAGVGAMTIQFHGRWVSDTFKTYTNLCAESVTSLAANMVTGSKGDSTLH